MNLNLLHQIHKRWHMAKLNDYFFDTIKNRYEEVQGRETRSEYWYFVLFSIIFSILFTLIDMFILNPGMVYHLKVQIRLGYFPLSSP